MISDADHHRAKVRELAQGPPDEPTHCELKREFALTANTEKAELVKDVAAFANTPLEHHGGYGYLIFGVSQNGHIQGVPESLGGDPPSDIRNLLNRHLERQIGFDYVTTHVDAGGEKRKLAAIVIPNSRRKPHVISRELQEQNAKKTKFLLRRGEVWTRKAGGRQLATAEDIDAMYELRLLGAVRDATDPLERRIQALEGELVDLKSALLVLSFGAALPDRREPGHEARVRPTIEALFTRERLNDLAAEIDWAGKRTLQEQKKRNARNIGSLSAISGSGPSSQEYAEYQKKLKDWLSHFGSFVMVELALSNTGEALAEDVYVEIEIPPRLSAYEELPVEKPGRLTDRLGGAMRSPPRASFLSKHNAPEELLGPEFDRDRRVASWEIGRLYHGRPVRTDSDEEYVNGLLLGRQAFEKLVSKNGFVDLSYTIRAANLRHPLAGALRLLPVPEGE